MEEKEQNAMEVGKEKKEENEAKTEKESRRTLKARKYSSLGPTAWL